MEIRNGLYSIHIEMHDGAQGRASGVIILRDGHLIGGDNFFYYTGSYVEVSSGKWRGELITHQHTKRPASVLCLAAEKSDADLLGFTQEMARPR